MKKAKLFYGWYILIACILVMALCYAPVVSCASLSISPITTEFGFSQGAFTVTKTITSLVGMAVAPFFGKIMAKKYMHLAWVISLIGVVAVFFAMSFASTLPQFYIISFVQGLFTTSAAMLPVNVVLTNWFQKKRAFIISIAMAGSGIGGTVLSKLMGWLIVDYGWRVTYRVLALIILVILVPVVGIFIRRTPEEKGLKAYGYGETLQSAGKAKPSREWNATLKELFQKPLFWVFIFGVAMTNFTGAAILHVPSAVVSAGYTLETASTVSSLYLLVAVPGKMILGYVYDKFGVKAGILFGNATMLVSMILLLTISSQPMLYIMAVAFGFGQCIGTVTPSVVASRTFGTKNYSDIFGFTTMFVNGGYALGVPVIGWLFDISGSYTLAWIVLGIMSIVMSLCLVFAYVASRKYAQNAKEEVKA